ncbi:F0F1 ATP synthase subunit alpha [Pseudomonas sp. BAY1663]|nr:F0F1 ATP synthase subunit alpha [Pseudomonas sp. BAY1663]
MQQLNPSEISEIIKQRIEKSDVAAQARNEGTVVSVSDGIVRIYGLADVMYGEMIEFPGGIFGMALNLEQDSVGAVVLGNYLGLTEGMSAKCTGRILEVPVGPELLGRVVDALGNPIDGKGPINAKETDAVEKVAPGVIWRKSVDQPVQTGYKSVDAMIPVGRGQRELIIGDRQIGKTAMAIDASSTSATAASVASTWPSVRSSRPSPTWCASWKSMAPWPTPSSSPPRLPSPPRCSTWLRTPAAPWASTSVTAVKTR